MTEHNDGEVKHAFEGSAPDPRSQVKDRAIEAMLAARPRRRRIWLLALAVLSLAGLGAAHVLPLFIEGELRFRSAEAGPGWTNVTGLSLLSGESERHDGFPTSDGDASPVSDEMVWSDFASPWPHYRGDVWRAKLDGSNAVNLTAAAGIGGMNCCPRWSPDGSMILFQHSDLEPGEYPCKAGWHVWVMNADGSAARRLTQEGELPTDNARWSPDGQWILCVMGNPEDEYSVAAKIHVSGADIIGLPEVGGDAAWSPDGALIASSRNLQGELENEPGVWRQLVLTDADGGHPEVLVEQFVVERELQECYPTDEQLADNPDFNWLGDVLTWVGPREPTWSPEGDQIAFLAALPFDPYGPYYRNQVEVWVYDLTTDELRQVTDDDVAQYSPRWNR